VLSPLLVRPKGHSYEIVAGARRYRAAQLAGLDAVAERMTATLDERRLSVLIRQHGIGKPKEHAAPAKLLAAFLPKAEESKLGRILVETAILVSMHNQIDTAKILRDTANIYKVDIDAISATVKQEFTEKEKDIRNAARKSPANANPKTAKKTAV
jgi:ParB family chromosome partitioning protein